MKLIWEPKAYIICRQIIDDKELHRFLADEGYSWQSDSNIAGEVVAEIAGRTCYMSFEKPRPGGNAAYLNHIKEAGHGSVLEHATWTLLLTGISRSLTHELVRHRAGMSPSQLSQRYVDESDCAFVIPPDLINTISEALTTIRNDSYTSASDYLKYSSRINTGEITDKQMAGIDWLACIENIHQKYCYTSDYLMNKYLGEGKKLSDLPPQERTAARKFARQAARSLLPNCTETKIVITANARALRNILEQRGSKFAEPEIRRLANVLYDVLVKESPNIFGDYDKETLGDGTYELVTQYRKV